MRSFSTLFLFGLLSCSAFATGDNLPSLIDRSDIVSTVLILNGEITESQSVGCGITYKGLVVNSFKGPGENTIVEFRLRKSLYVGGAYLIFATNALKPVDTIDKLLSFLDIQAENCANEGVNTTLSAIKGQLDYEAIFEVRELGELSKEGQGPYYVGPIQSKEFFGDGVESYEFTLHTPDASLVRAAINAEQFHAAIAEITAKLVESGT